MKLQMFFYQNLVKTQNQNFQHKFTFLGLSQNFVFSKMVPLSVRGHVCIDMKKKEYQHHYKSHFVVGIRLSLLLAEIEYDQRKSYSVQK